MKCATQLVAWIQAVAIATLAIDVDAFQGDDISPSADASSAADGDHVPGVATLSTSLVQVQAGGDEVLLFRGVTCEPFNGGFMCPNSIGRATSMGKTEYRFATYSINSDGHPVASSSLSLEHWVSKGITCGVPIDLSPLRQAMEQLSGAGSLYVNQKLNNNHPALKCCHHLQEKLRYAQIQRIQRISELSDGSDMGRIGYHGKNQISELILSDNSYLKSLQRIRMSAHSSDYSEWDYSSDEQFMII